MSEGMDNAAWVNAARFTVSLVTIVVNVAVIAIAVRYPAFRRSACNCMITLLAVSDVVVGRCAGVGQYGFLTAGPVLAL